MVNLKESFQPLSMGLTKGKPNKRLVIRIILSNILEATGE